MANNTEIQQGNDLKNIGSVLKQKREELSYTLEHVSEITRITLTCLRNIEEGNLKALPGLVFVKGFIRNYAKLLGLESDWMIEALNHPGIASGEPAAPIQDSVSVSHRENTQPKNTIFYYTVGLAIVCTALLIFYVLYKKPSAQLSLNEENVETVQAIASPEEMASSEQAVTEIPSIAAVEGPETPVTAPPVISPLTLTLVALEDEWIRLSIDEQDPFELRLKKGEKYEWPGEEEYALTMTTGKTAVIHLNGEEIVERESFPDQLYQVELNKFTLKQINNR